MAAPGQAQPPNMNLFDSYFTRADLDRDGRISGQEAVAFFQGSNLPKPVLAQIWTYADQNQTGFLGRPEFYNCLKLVTVAQSGRQLTPDMVKAALYGPAAAKIPPPQINLVPSSGGAQTNSLPTSTSQLNPMMRPSGQMSVAALSSSQNIGFRGPQPTANLGTNQQFLTSTPLASVPLQGVNQGFSGAGGVVDPRLSSSNTPKLVTDWHTPRTSGASVGAISQGSVRGSALPANQDGFGLAVPGIAPGIPPKLQNQPPLASSGPPNPVSPQSQPAVNNFKSLAFSGNSFSNSVSEGTAFTSTYQTKSDVSGPSFSGNITTNLSSGSASVTAVSHNSNMMSQLDSLYGSSVPPQAGGYPQPAQSLTKQYKVDAVPSTSAAANVLVGPASSTGQSQLNWPKITQSDIQKYTRVFVEVDKDRDGKITGEQARSLFISWRLPREVLKQVWDLSDQDNDSMLSLREFCTALYLMERYREGRPLPDVLPNTLKYDETLLRSTTQPSNAYSGQAFQPNPGLSHQGIPGARPPLPGVRPPLQTSFPLHTDGMGQHVQQNSRIPGLDKHMVNQFGKEQSASGIQFQEATNADKKKLKEEILDSKEKIEFYRTMMQELVLYKSRCDNRLNEITERASADKREAESLGKKYEEKYKQVGELASKLTVEEATHRDVQERKMELQSAITKMDQGGSADGLLQVRADRIQNHLEELMKALDDRCKHHGLHVKSTGIIELPFGWQPGIPDVAVDWDEDWDKFEDDGFVVAKDLTIDVDNAVTTAKPKSPSTWSDKVSMDEFSPDSSSNFNIKNEKSSSTNARITESESAYDQSEEDFARSPTGSAGRSALGSPSQEFHATEFGTRDNSPLGRESHRPHAESTISGDKFPDEPSWSFDGNDDAESVWDYNSTLAKENDYDGSGPSSFFDSGDYGLKPIKVDSPSAISTFGKENKCSFFADSPSGVSTFGKDNKSSFFADSPSAASTFGKENKSSFFADSVPSTPLFNSGLSPKFNDGAEDNSFSSFGRFDSFSTKDKGFFPQRESFTRFDSMRSTADFDHKQSESFSRFDSMRSTAGFDNRQGESFARFDSMRSTTGFDNNRQGESFARFDSMRSTTGFDNNRQGDSFARFDSMRSTTGFDHNRGFPSFDDADPFGSTGPFKSSESHSPKRGSDNWSAF